MDYWKPVYRNIPKQKFSTNQEKKKCLCENRYISKASTTRPFFDLFLSVSTRNTESKDRIVTLTLNVCYKWLTFLRLQKHL